MVVGKKRAGREAPLVALIKSLPGSWLFFGAAAVTAPGLAYLPRLGPQVWNRFAHPVSARTGKRTLTDHPEDVTSICDISAQLQSGCRARNPRSPYGVRKRAIPLTIQVPSGCLVAARSSVWLPSVGGPRARRTSFASQRLYGGAAQIAVVAHPVLPARVGRGPVPVRNSGCFVTDDRERVDGRSRGERGNGTARYAGPRHKPACMLSPTLKPI
jgi:hypothetical protein